MSVFYLDHQLGSDTYTATPLGWWSCDYTAGNGTQPPAEQTGTGGTSGKTANVTVCTVSSGTWAGTNGAGTLYWYGKSGTFTAGETVTFTNGATCTITADLAYCAWYSFTNGAIAARIAPGDTIRCKKCDDPHSVGDGIWTSTTNTGGGFPATQSITSSTDATPIVITKNSHGYVNGDIVQIVGHTTNTNANGIWKVANKATNTFELEDSTATGGGAGGATGTIQKINSKVVQLATAQTKTLTRCEKNWTANGTGDATVSLVTYATFAKEGGNSMKMVLDASQQANIMQAYFPTGTLDLSAYQKISFWVSAVYIYKDLSFKIKLCSDALGGITLTGVVFSDNGGDTVLGTKVAHGLSTGAKVTVSGCTQAYANATWELTVTGVDTFTLDGASWASFTGADVTGDIDTATDIFTMPDCNAVAIQQRWTPLTLSRVGGGNLGKSIKSIAIYSVNASTMPSTTTYWDNFVATKTDNISLTSLISKNSLKVGGTEAWYGIQSISENGKLVALDNAPATLSNIGRGYFTSGTSPETVTTYIREPLNGKLATTSGEVVNNTLEAGTSGNIDTYSGGWDTATNVQDSMTIVSFGCGYGRAFGILQNYTKLEYLGSVRALDGIYNTSGDYQILSNLSSTNNAGYGMSISGAGGRTLTNLLWFNNNVFDGIYNGGTQNLDFTFLQTNNNLGNGFYPQFYGNKVSSFSSASNNATSGIVLSYRYLTINGNSAVSNYNGAYGIEALGNNCIVRNVSTVGNLTSGIRNTAFDLYMKSCTISESTEVSGMTAGNNAQTFSSKHDGSAYSRIISEAVVADSLANDRGGGTGNMWKMTFTGPTRLYYYPFKLKLAKFAVVANKAITVSAYMKKDHATKVMGRLVVLGQQLTGVNSDVTTDASSVDTSWHQVTLSDFTPTEAGVIEVEVWAWYVAGDNSVYISELSISQAA